MDQIKIQALAHFNASLQTAAETQPSAIVRTEAALLEPITTRTGATPVDDEEENFQDESEGDNSDIVARTATPEAHPAPAV